jgi:hypothetical protein
LQDRKQTLQNSETAGGRSDLRSGERDMDVTTLALAVMAALGNRFRNPSVESLH